MHYYNTSCEHSYAELEVPSYTGVISALSKLYLYASIYTSEMHYFGAIVQQPNTNLPRYYQ